MWPHRRQPTRLSCPWDSPGKNTGVGCHFLLQCMKVKSESEVAQSCPTLWDPLTTAHQAPLSMGFSRQKQWRALPFPSPKGTIERKKVKLLVSDSLSSHGLQPTRLLHPWDFPGKSTGVGCHCLLLLHCRRILYHRSTYSIWNTKPDISLGIIIFIVE